MITVCAGRLDLYGMCAGEKCQIVTSPENVRILWPEGGVDTGVAPSGTGSVWLKDQWLCDHWINLAALAAGKVYEVETYQTEGTGSITSTLREVALETGFGPSIEIGID